jgi:hypothetical protein
VAFPTESIASGAVGGNEKRDSAFSSAFEMQFESRNFDWPGRSNRNQIRPKRNDGDGALPAGLIKPMGCPNVEALAMLGLKLSPLASDRIMAGLRRRTRRERWRLACRSASNYVRRERITHRKKGRAELASPFSLLTIVMRIWAGALAPARWLSRSVCSVRK